MKDIIFDNLPSLNIKLTKNKFLKACSSMPAYMPEACKSFIKMIQQCLDNIIYEIRIIVRACFLQSSQAPLCSSPLGACQSKNLQADDAAWQRTSVLIGFDHSFCLQSSWTSQATKSMSLQEKDMGKDYMQQNRYIVGHCCNNRYAQ